MDSPFILDETENYAVVFKPSKMFCTSGLKQDFSGTLYEWFAEKTSSVFDIMHRLDYETNGLVLFAKNEISFNNLKSAQDKGEFIKEYSAICLHSEDNNSPTQFSNSSFLIPHSADGFPPCPLTKEKIKSYTAAKEKPPLFIESYFRPYGPGRKLVRPVTDDKKRHKEIAKDKGCFYRTEIIDISDNLFKVRIKRGFRHQIRCHLCWMGCPILNDPFYSKEDFFSDGGGILALRSHAFFFPDPLTGKQQEYRIPALAEDYSRLTAL